MVALEKDWPLAVPDVECPNLHVAGGKFIRKKTRFASFKVMYLTPVRWATEKAEGQK
jgi:hypothetical protein